MLKIYGISGDNREDYALALSDGTSLLESKLYAALSHGSAEDSDGGSFVVYERAFS